jgi:predicted Rossmann fold flavoprotein
MNKHYNVIVIGGGPAGMMAAGRAAELGAHVLLLEKNERLGKKLALTGGGRCNITNAEFDNHLFLDNFKEHKQFLLSPFSQFNSENTFKFFKEIGLPLIVESQLRAFPKSESAEDVCAVLCDYLKRHYVEIKTNTTVEGFLIKEEKVVGVETSAGDFRAPKIILATGGLAAPETGSTGDGFAWLKKLGHTITKPDTSLAPLKTSAKWVRGLSGVSVDEMELRFLQDKKTKHKVRGRLLFTHFGISGPLVINSAHKVKKLLGKGDVIASVDLFPKHDLGSLDKHLLDLFEQNSNKLLKTLMKELTQKKLAETALQLSSLGTGDIPAHSVTKEQRKGLVRALKALQFPITGIMGLDWSIVADGGVRPKQIDFKHMNSRLHPNLYLIGDIVDINRPSGGFSLQLCWTMGFVAGSHAGQKD